jgi:hypothetical protein
MASSFLDLSSIKGTQVVPDARGRSAMHITGSAMVGGKLIISNDLKVNAKWHYMVSST